MQKVTRKTAKIMSGDITWAARWHWQSEIQRKKPFSIWQPSAIFNFQFSSNRDETWYASANFDFDNGHVINIKILQI